MSSALLEKTYKKYTKTTSARQFKSPLLKMLPMLRHFGRFFMRHSFAVFLFLVQSFFIVPAFSTVLETKESDFVAKLLKDRTNANDAFYSKVLSPAKSLELDKNSDARIQTVIDQMTKEFDLVTTAFKDSNEEQKVNSVNAAVNKIEPEVVKAKGAYITFVDASTPAHSGPSSGVARIVMLVPKKGPQVTAASVLATFSSFKHSAKASDYFYEYENARNITSGAVKTTVGNDSTWVLPTAAAPFVVGQDHVIKKCRQLLGWRCVTSVYRTDSFFSAAEAFNMLFIAIYDLENNLDHADFAKDKRSTNQIAGSTAVYIIKESPSWVLIYGVDAQWNKEKLMFSGVIQQEFQKDYVRLKERLSLDLKIKASDLK